MTPKGGKSTDHDHNLISSEGAQDTSSHQHAKFQTILSMRSPANARKPLRTDVLEKTQMCCDKNRWRFICSLRIIQESGVYQLGVPQGRGDSSAPSTTDPLTDGQMDGRTCRKTVTVGRMDQWTHVQVKRGYFRLRTDGQPENMPPAPKGAGIKIMMGSGHKISHYTTGMLSVHVWNHDLIWW